MTKFEKIQRIESIKGIIKARWFAIIIIVGLGLILKTKYFGGLWGDFFDFLKIIGLGFIVFSYNFIYWQVLKKPPEKISNRAINVLSAAQIIADQLVYTLVYYFTGTIETIAFILYYITILIASSLYKTRGIILTGFLAVILYTGATLADYYSLVPHVYPFPGEAGWYGNLYMTRVKIIGFIFYTGAAIFFSVFLSALIRNRENRLRQQRDQLHKKTELLTSQSQKLSAAKSGLEAEKNKVEAVIKSLTDGLVLLDASGRIVMANKIARQFLGLADSSDFLGKKIKEISAPEAKELEKILLAKAGPIQRVEMPLPKANRILEISTADVHDAGGRQFGRIVILHDVTREKAIDKIKSDFVTIAAHQLRTPLTAIKWVFSILLSGDAGKISQEQKEVISKGDKSNDRIIILIDDLLQAARIEEGRFIYEFKKTAFAKILNTVLDKLAPLARDKKIKMEINKPDGFAPIIKADEEKMEMALNNLIENALFYTPESGTIAIALSPTPEGGRLVLEIKDNGIGIPRENFDRMFSKFFRAENAIKAQTEGSGLGLFIVKNIIESHGGKIWFESEEGVGTAFYVSLPIG